MTEREKIAQIIAEHLCPQGKAHKTLYGSERRCYSRDNFAECEKVSECVDALIAAGIGDVGKWKHRAERADRALINTCAILYAQGVEYPYSDEEWQLQQAEKELQEGKKDE